MELGWLVELIREVEGRYRRMREWDNAMCPESKITPSMSRDPALNMPITAPPTPTQHATHFPEYRL